MVMSRTLLPAADPGAIGTGRLSEKNQTASAPAAMTAAATAARTDALRTPLLSLKIFVFVEAVAARIDPEQR